MSNKIRIKRRFKGDPPGDPPSLVTGELAYDETKGTLYYGESDGDLPDGAAYPRMIGGSGYIIPIITGIIGNTAVPKLRTLTPGSGLVGQDALDLSADRTFHVGQGTGIIIDDDNVNIDPVIRNITGTITATVPMGSITVGQTFNSNDSVTSILRSLLETVLLPRISTPPALALSSFGGITSGSEIGTTGNLTINLSYNAGQIRGTGLGANWNNDGVLGNRLGAATSYTIEGVTSATPSVTINAQQLNSARRTINFSATHLVGVTALNSLGAVATNISPNPAPAATINGSANLDSFRGIFYGWSKVDNIPPSSSNDIRALNTATSNVSGTMVNATAPYTFTLNIPSGVKKIIVAFPSGVQSFSNGKPATNAYSGIKAINDSNFEEEYTAVNINVFGANGFTSIPYFVKYFIPNVEYTAPLSSHIITIR